MKDQITEPPKCFEELLEAASQLTANSSIQEISEFLKAAAKLDLTPLEANELLKVIKQTTGKELKPLRQELKMHQDNAKLNAPDPALLVAKETLKTHYADGAILLQGKDGRFWVYDKTHWVEIVRGAIATAAFQVANQPQFALLTDNLPALAERATKVIGFMIEATDDPLDLMGDPPPVINCQNGEVWLDKNGTPKLGSHSPQSRLMSCLPIGYDPSATCPKFDKAIAEIFAEAKDPQGLVRHFLEFAGYAIQPQRDIPSFWLLIGHGANGKSKLLETIAGCLSPDAIAYRGAQSFKTDNFAMASLAGKSLLIDDDMTENTELPDGLIKAISEKKPRTARHAYGRRAFTFICRSMPVMAGNSYPRTSDVSFGMVRRAKVIPFARKFAGAADDPELFSKIWGSEMPGVLNRFIEGLIRLRLRGDFDPPIDCQEALADFMVHANPVFGFMEDFCEADPDSRVQLRHLWPALGLWCKDQGLRLPCSKNQLRRKLLGLNCTVKKVQGYNTLYGFALKSEPNFG